MAKLITLVLSLTCSFQFVFSQTGTTRYLDKKIEEDSFTDRLYECIPSKDKFRYPEFREGYVYYAQHKQSLPTRLNYNCYRAAISMISTEGDTLFLANFESVKYILIGQDLYFHDFNQGYFEVISDPNDSIRLVVQHKQKILRREVLQDYEKPEIKPDKNYFSVIYIPRNPLLAREKVTISNEKVFYLLNRHEQLLIANHVSILKLFPNHKEEIDDYLMHMARNKNRIKFQNEKDLKKLLAFCQTLAK